MHSEEVVEYWLEQWCYEGLAVKSRLKLHIHSTKLFQVWLDSAVSVILFVELKDF